MERDLKAYAARNLRAWREASGLSRPQVAAAINRAFPRDYAKMDQATIAKWEKGDSAVRMMDAIMLAKVYGCEPGMLFWPPADRGRIVAIKRLIKAAVYLPPEQINRNAERVEQQAAARRRTRRGLSAIG